MNTKEKNEPNPYDGVKTHSHARKWNGRTCGNCVYAMPDCHTDNTRLRACSPDDPKDGVPRPYIFPMFPDRFPRTSTVHCPVVMCTCEKFDGPDHILVGVGGSCKYYERRTLEAWKSKDIEVVKLSCEMLEKHLRPGNNKTSTGE